MDTKEPYECKRFPPDLIIEMNKNSVFIDRDTNLDDYDIVFSRADLEEFIALLNEMSRQMEDELRAARA